MKKNLQHYFRIFSENRGLTVQEHEKIFDEVFKKTKREDEPLFPTMSSAFLRKVGIVFSVCLMLSAVVYWRTLTKSTQYPGTEPGEYTARGGGTKAFFDARCIASEQSEECRWGDVMVFKVQPPQQQRFFSSFSRHKDTKAIVWYYPSTANEESLLLDETGANRLMDEGIAIGNDHALGEYEVFSVFSDHPLMWDDIRKLFDEDVNIVDDKYIVLKEKIVIKK